MPTLVDYCGTSVAGYHAVSRWDSILQGVDFSDDSLMGVEIEIDCATQHLLMQELSQVNVIVERDGSLGPHGVELVLPPIPYKCLLGKSALSDCLDVFKRIKCGRQNSDRYGIHVSVNGDGMDLDHKKHFMEFFHKNKSFCEGIAKRPGNNYCRYNPWCYSLNELISTGKYAACSWRSDSRLEVRIFKSTDNAMVIRSYLQFVRAVWDYTQFHASYEADRFVEWLSQPVKAREYPYLRLFMPSELRLSV